MGSEQSSRRLGLDIFDILLLCWIVIVVAYASSMFLPEWIGKGQYLLTECLILLLSVGYLRLRKQQLQSLFRWNTIPVGVLLGSLIIAIGAAPILDGLDRLVGLVIAFPAEQSEGLTKSLTPGNPWDILLLVLGLGFAAPFTEESLFRGAIQQTIEERLDVTGGVMLTALIFALIHLQYWWLIQLLLMAVFLGYLAWRSNSIIPAVLIHGANNLWSLYLTISPNSVPQFYLLRSNQMNPLVWVVGFMLVASGLYIVERFMSSDRLRLES